MISLGKSIRSKVIAIILLMSTAALTVGMIGVGINYYNSTKQAMILNAETQATLLANNAAVPLSLGSVDLLDNVLESAVLGGEFGAAIFDNLGNILATR
ncbi:MAG: hypothetical protein OQJ89_06835, partial [Kangiellaceae bacterium]|nr:hypothetical protein [Kangiellaceae bacterium]